MIQNIRNFFSQVRAEMMKVTWPNREELIGSTGVVLFTMFIMSTFIFFADLVVSQALKIILR